MRWKLAIAVALLGAILGSCVGGHALCERRAADAHAREWRWDDVPVDLEAEVRRVEAGLNLEIVLVPSAGFFESDRLLRIRGSEVTREINVHAETPLARHGDVIFVPEFDLLTTGCTVSAVHGPTGRHLWRRHLRGLELHGNDKYWNHVRVEVFDDVLIVRGNEMNGRYIEWLDLASGKEVWRKKLD